MLKFDNSISRGFRFESMFIFALSGFINAILALIFGAFVYFKNKERRINRIFGLMSFSIVLWGFSYGMWQLSKDKETALFWSRILSLGATFIPVLFLDWVLTLLNFQKFFGKFIKINLKYHHILLLNI